MKNQSRLTAISIAALLGLTLTACDDDGSAAEEDDEDAEVSETDNGEEQDGDEEVGDADAAEGGDADGDAGTRDNPLSLGETVSGNDWELTVNDVVLNADDQVAAENEFNDPAPEGASYVLINVEATYTGDESEMPMIGTEVAWVAESGETIQAFDSMAIAPDEFDSATELYDGGTEAGNIAIAVPQDDEGLVRVRLGLFDQEEAFFAPE